MFTLNFGQRIIALLAGVLLLLFAIGSSDSYDSGSKWLATAQFVLAVICFIIAAAAPRAKSS